MSSARPLLHSADRPLTASVIGCLVVLLSLRLAISALSFGSDDAKLWMEFALSLQSHGLLETYDAQPAFNHPPLMAFAALAIFKLAAVTGLSFGFLFRLLPIAADVVTGLALYQYTSRVWVLALFALDPISLLISGHHTNTDSVYACLTLLGVIALSHGRDHAAGLLLGAAINVKLVPLFVIVPLLIAIPFRRGFRVVFGGLPMAIPFVILALADSDALTRNLFGYRGLLNFWGMGAVIWMYLVHTHTRRTFDAALQSHASLGPKIVLPSLVVIGVILRRAKPTGPALVLASATAAAAFFALSPNFATQYTVLLGPLLLAACPRVGVAWCVTCGALLWTDYGLHWTGTWPAYTKQTTYLIRPPVPWIAIAPWLVSAGFLVRQLWLALRPADQLTAIPVPPADA